MHDENHHNDPLELFFYKKANEFEIPFREDDWLILEKRLDIYDLQRSYRNKFRFMAAASILILALLGYFTLDNYNRLNQLSAQFELESLPDTQSNLPVDNLPPTIDFNHPSIAGIDDSFIDERSVSTVTASVYESADEYSTLNGFQQSVIGMMEHRKLESEYINNAYGDNHSLVDINKYTSAITSNNLFNLDHSVHMNVAYQEPIYTAGSIDESSYHFNSSRIGIGFAVSPDKSSTGLSSNYGETGYRIGIKGEFRLSDNLYLTAGVLASNVYYATSGSRYSPPEYWNHGVNPDHTTAICMILDIPIGFKYNVINFNGSRLFATAGFTSYIMLREDYRFDYKSGYKSLESNLVVNNGSRHLFNNINLSVGYELELFPSWNLRAEPFINVPVSGVGWGDVKLYSIGSYISIIYQL